MTRHRDSRRRWPSESEARYAVSRHEGVTVAEVRVLEVETRPVGPVARYIIDGQPGVHRLLVEIEEGEP